jgi:hypothetical protein
MLCIKTSYKYRFFINESKLNFFRVKYQLNKPNSANTKIAKSPNKNGILAV